MLVALVFRRNNNHYAGDLRHSFAIVIPAHNEESTIAGTLESCAALDYPAGEKTVYVIADNCSDGTIEVAQQHGAACLVRRDETRLGKGYALEWALPQVLANGHDAILILDADCEIDAKSLLVFNAHLANGRQVLQANYAVANPDHNPRTYLLALANTLENEFFYAPKSKLNMAVFLRGTGMVLHGDVLAEFPWRARSIVEDAEYSCQLLQHGRRIAFVPEIKVTSPFPEESGQLAVQRTRWIGGAVKSLASLAPRMIWLGFRNREIALFDAALTMMIVSRPLIIAEFALALSLAAICWAIAPGSWSILLLTVCLLAAAGYAAYVLAGIVRLGISPRRLGLLASSPIQIVEYLLISLRSLIRLGGDGWQRTPRTK